MRSGAAGSIGVEHGRIEGAKRHAVRLIGLPEKLAVAGIYVLPSNHDDGQGAWRERDVSDSDFEIVGATEAPELAAQCVGDFQRSSRAPDHVGRGRSCDRRDFAARLGNGFGLRVVKE